MCLDRKGLVLLSSRCQEFSLTASLTTEKQDSFDLGSFLLDNFVLVYVLANRQTALFIDSGWDEYLAEEIITLAQKRWSSRGFSPQQFYLLNTHADWDHAWANRPFRKAFRDRLCIGASLKTVESLLRAKEEGEVARRREGQSGQTFSHSFIELPDTVWKDGEICCLGGLQVEFIGSESHCPGHLGLLLSRFQALFAGDMVEWPLPFPKNCQCLPQQLNELRRLKKLKLKHIYPSHIDNCYNDINSAWNLCWRSGVLPNCNLNYIEKLGSNIKRKLADNRVLFNKCLDWFASQADELANVLENEDNWDELQKGNPLLTNLINWEAEFNVSPDRFTVGDKNYRLNWFYQRAHHLFVFMYLRALLPEVAGSLHILNYEVL
ncbi:MAG: MBL fold metallo-hydrolase [Candidatus Bruticola sp.]